MEKLIKIQSELKVPKGNFNSFGKYKYRSCEDILEAVKPLLTKYECTLLLTDDIVQVGNKIYLKAIAKLSDGKLEASVTGFAETGEHKGMSSEQCTGTASSYARKYALNGLFLIDETEADADHDNKQAPKEQPTPQQPSTPTAKPSLSNERFDAAFKAVEDGKLTKQELAVKMSEFQLTGTQKINLKNFLEDGQ